MCLPLVITLSKNYGKWVTSRWVRRAADFYCNISCKTLHSFTSNLYVSAYLNTREEHKNVFIIPSMWTNNFSRFTNEKSSYLHMKTSHSWFLANCYSYFLKFAPGKIVNELSSRFVSADLLYAMESTSKKKLLHKYFIFLLQCRICMNQNVNCNRLHQDQCIYYSDE